MVKCLNDIILPPHTNKHIISHAKGKKSDNNKDNDDDSHNIK